MGNEKGRWEGRGGQSETLAHCRMAALIVNVSVKSLPKLAVTYNTYMEQLPAV